MGPQLVSSYQELLQNDSSIKALIGRVPWVLTGTLQSLDILVRSLINEAERLDETDLSTKFSIITPLWNTSPRYMRDLIASCQMQTYQNWELILVDDGSKMKEHFAVIEQASVNDKRIKFFEADRNGGISAARNTAIDCSSGTFVCVLDHDDILHPQILGIYARLLNEQQHADLIYCNEVKVSDDLSSLSEFCSKPDYCFATLLRTNYICHFTAISRAKLEQVKTDDGQYFRSKYDSVEDHDLFLRLTSLPDFSVIHVPVFGYYWRTAISSTALDVGTKPGVWGKGVTMLATHLGSDVSIVAKGGRGKNELYSVHFQSEIKDKDIAVVIPFRDNPHLTIDCLQSVEKQVLPGKLNVILVDNGSENRDTLLLIKQWLDKPRTHSYSLVSHPGAFNYSRINNWAVAKHCQQQKYILFLNNDVVLQTESSLSVMAGELDRHPDVGVIGMRLLYRDGVSLQHGGMSLLRSPAKMFSPIHIRGSREFVCDEHVTFAVTFACALVRAETFREIGGFDEVFFANGLSDVDLCCRFFKHGKKVFYMGTLTGVHLESETRKSQAEEFEVQMLNQRHGDVLGLFYLKQYGYNLVAPNSADSNEWYAFPLRYRLADRLNKILKDSLGPIHSFLKKAAEPR